MSITLPLTTTLPSLHRKKLSNFCHHSSWHRDSNNYVAKSYMVPVDRRTYFDDVKLQMEAKLWSEEYNRHNPPKKVRRGGSAVGEGARWWWWARIRYIIFLLFTFL